MLYAMLAACATLIFVLASGRSSRGQGPSPGTPLSGTAGVGRDGRPPHATPSVMPPGGPGYGPARWGRRIYADYRGGVTCLYDTQLLGACLHASECGGRSRPEAVRGMPDVPIAPPATGPPEGWAAVGFVSPASFNRGLWARLLRVLGS